ncbi:hypothetical protein SAMN05421630_103446 [Prauserella marina]|uniref:Uncharacterized protein n=1 Tax=Prauserella marina TaxID=530584 RepID=A0A1G6P449_9PSEU|nr:DUF5677 domain-containing protein [Prauserella marina]PWV82666.1 hypothetical protein DES30_102910 [Prauserella marina]SDC74205.1 hypothetical protein SAMN05421630_103446 [Prauserella marina]
MTTPEGNTLPEQPDLLGPPANADELLAEAAPWFGETANNVMTRSLPFVRSFFGEAENYPAVATIFNQGLSDLIGLLIELSHGNGRSAVRSARSLIEHAVNIRDVESTPGRAQRYLDHLGFGAKFANDFSLGLDLLTRSQKRKVTRQRAHTLKKASRELDKATEKYGKGFRRGWSEENLKDRCEKFNLLHLYPAYQLASLIIHGAPGGILGLVREIEGHRVHRTGIAIHLCPFAYIAGIEAAKEIASTVGRQRPDLDIQPQISALDTLRKRWPQYVEAANKVDKKIWPKSPPRHATAILAVTRSGGRRWYWFDPQTEIVIESNAPNLTDEQEGRVSERVSSIVDSPENFFVNGRNFATVCLEETLIVTPNPDAPALPATAIMLAPEEAKFMHQYTIHPNGTVE